jgi:hypothetical protein
VGDAGAAFKLVVGDLFLQLGHARGAARALEAAGIHRDAARVITAVFKALQALHQDGNDISCRNGSNDAAHRGLLEKSMCGCYVLAILLCD